jgi:hypothetical protein
MLLWESIQSALRQGKPLHLPRNKRCAARTKAGTRCRGRTRRNKPWCIFHDPSVDLAERRRASGRGGAANRRTRYHLDGVAARITTRRGITEALDRLYNDTRAGLIAPETGLVLFQMLERLWGTFKTSGSRRIASGKDHSQAARLRRKLARRYIRAVDKHKGQEQPPDHVTPAKRSEAAA